MVALASHDVAGAADVPPPDKFVGHPVAADFLLDRWEKIVAYFKHVDVASDRVALQTLGQTTEGRPMIIAVVSSPETIRDLDRHRANQRRIADPRLIATDEEQQRLVHDSKPVV